ncbi:PepSY-associated TM helix domain-containing protein [Larkinella harenae]
MSVKKLIGYLHRWLGFASGLVVFVVSLTGCIFVFEEELYAIFHRDLVYVTTPGTKTVLPVAVLKANAQKALGPEAEINSVNIFSEPDKAYAFEVFQNDPNQAEDSFWDNTGLFWKRIYVDPYTGKVNGIIDMQYEFFITVRAIHQNLYINPKIGSPLVGSATLIFMVMLLSGLVLWWPKNKAAAKQRFWFRWKDNTKLKRKNYDLHNILGFYVLTLGLFIGLTGIVWSFKWWENTVFRLLDGRVTQFAYPPPPVASSVQNPGTFDRILEKMMVQHPQFLRIYLSENKAENFMIAAVNNPSEDLWTHYSYSYYDLSTGLEYARLRHEDKTRGQKWRNSNYDLHTGKTLGYPGMILAFLASLISASLPVTGFYIWWGRRKITKKKGRSQASVNRKIAG